MKYTRKNRRFRHKRTKRFRKKRGAGFLSKTASLIKNTVLGKDYSYLTNFGFCNEGPDVIKQYNNRTARPGFVKNNVAGRKLGIYTACSVVGRSRYILANKPNKPSVIGTFANITIMYDKTKNINKLTEESTKLLIDQTVDILFLITLDSKLELWYADPVLAKAMAINFPNGKETKMGDVEVYIPLLISSYKKEMRDDTTIIEGDSFYPVYTDVIVNEQATLNLVDNSILFDKEIKSDLNLPSIMLRIIDVYLCN